MTTIDSEDRMKKTFCRLAAFGIGAAMQGSLIGFALAQGTPPSSSVGGSAPQYGAADAMRIGKKFVEKGQAQPGQQGIVRQEDLPKVLRWITPSSGIRGITQNPNRLTLILGDDNTIVEAFWE
jgi:hypothetical protein